MGTVVGLGLKEFFLSSGKYLEVLSEIYDTAEFQLAKTAKRVLNIWRGTVSIRLENPSNPLLEL